MNNSQNKSNDLTKIFNMKGRVKSMSSTSFDANPDQWSLWNPVKSGRAEKESERERFDFEFDQRGNRLQLIVYRSDGGVDSKTTWAYNKIGTLLEEARHVDGRVFKTTYTYTANGNLAEEARHVDGRIFKTTYTYTANGNLAEKIDYESDGSKGRRTTYTYTANGNLAEEFVIDKSGATLDTYRWDASGRCIEVKSYAPDEGFTEFLSEGEGDMQDRISYSYDEYGNTVREFWEREEEEEGWIQDAVTYKFEYDDIGNWITRVKFTEVGRYDSDTGDYESVPESEGSAYYKTGATEVIERTHVYFD